MATGTLPGLRLFHEGQFEGLKVRLPVFLGRRPDEPVDQDLSLFYGKLLEAINRPVFREGEWYHCDRTGWPDNNSFQNLIAWCWRKGDEQCLMVINLSDCPAQARVSVPLIEAGSGSWLLIDAFSGATYEREGDEMRSPGLYVELGPWGYHFLRMSHYKQDRGSQRS